MSEHEPKQELQLLDPSDQRLQQVSEAVPVEEIASVEIQQIVDVLLAVASGERSVGPEKSYMVGLAAPQLGIMKRIIVVDTQIRHGKKPDSNAEVPPLVALINPEIVEHGNKIYDFREGCYSYYVKKGIHGVVPRFTNVRVRAYDRDAQPVELEADDYTARILQHEIDHLNGIRYHQRMPEDRPLDLVKPDELQAYAGGEWETWPNHIDANELA